MKVELPSDFGGDSTSLARKILSKRCFLSKIVPRLAPNLYTFYNSALSIPVFSHSPSGSPVRFHSSCTPPGHWNQIAEMIILRRIEVALKIKESYARERQKDYFPGRLAAVKEYQTIDSGSRCHRRKFTPLVRWVRFHFPLDPAGSNGNEILFDSAVSLPDSYPTWLVCCCTNRELLIITSGIEPADPTPRLPHSVFFHLFHRVGMTVDVVMLLLSKLQSWSSSKWWINTGRNPPALPRILALGTAMKSVLQINTKL